MVRIERRHNMLPYLGAIRFPLLPVHEDRLMAALLVVRWFYKHLPRSRVEPALSEQLRRSSFAPNHMVPPNAARVKLSVKT